MCRRCIAEFFQEQFFSHNHFYAHTHWSLGKTAAGGFSMQRRYIFPLFVKHGIAGAEDIESFPLSLRRKLIVLMWSAIGLFAALALLVALWESGALK